MFPKPESTKGPANGLHSFVQLGPLSEALSVQTSLLNTSKSLRQCAMSYILTWFDMLKKVAVPSKNIQNHASSGVTGCFKKPVSQGNSQRKKNVSVDETRRVGGTFKQSFLNSVSRASLSNLLGLFVAAGNSDAQKPVADAYPHN